MPRTVEEILEHADELAARFETYEPCAEDERDPAAFTALRDAVTERAAAERHLVQAVSLARGSGMS